MNMNTITEAMMIHPTPISTEDGIRLKDLYMKYANKVDDVLPNFDALPNKREDNLND